MKSAVVAGVVVLAMSFTPVFARGRKQNTTTKQMSDQEFVMSAAKGNMAEIELGKLAETRASSDQVKTFAKRMVDVTLGSFVLAVIFVGASALSARANGCDKLSYLTFSAPVSLPGVALPAGTYQFTHPDCSSIDHILRVSSQDGRRVYATVLAIPENRPTPSDQAVVVFGEMPAGSPKAIRAWFYAGETIGDELIYPEGEARTIADASDRSRSATAGAPR